MIRYETTTKLRPDEVLVAASDFFAGDLGLTEQRRDDSVAMFLGGGGGVALSATAADGATTVELVAREWEVPAREFLGRLKRRRHSARHATPSGSRSHRSGAEAGTPRGRDTR